jgi:hypothetical protein
MAEKVNSVHGQDGIGPELRDSARLQTPRGCELGVVANNEAARRFFI